MKARISIHPAPLRSFDFSREYGYIGFDIWRLCFFFKWKKSVAK